MKRFFQSEAGAVVLWVLCTLLLAASIAPWVYSAGKALASHAAAEELPAFLEWLADACRRSKFPRFFNRSLMLSALVLIPVLLRRIRRLRHAGTPALPKRTSYSWGEGLQQWLTGLVVAGGLLWLLGAALQAAGAFVWKGESLEAPEWLTKALIPAVGVSLLEEWLFRGLILGVWLRIARPLAACLGTSAVFAFVHFLTPPKGVVIAEPEALLAGFELLGHILIHFLNPRFFAADFITLFAVGLILAFSRIRTGALWFAVGLHTGWVFTFKGFNLLYESADHPLHPWGVGEDLRSGLLPLGTLVITGFACHALTAKWARRRDSRRLVSPA